MRVTVGRYRSERSIKEGALSSRKQRKMKVKIKIICASQHDIAAPFGVGGGEILIIPRNEVRGFEVGFKLNLSINWVLQNTIYQAPALYHML